MAEITIRVSVPDGREADLLEEFAKANGWKSAITVDGEEVQNPVLPQEFLDDFYTTQLRTLIIESRANEAKKEAVESQDNSDLDTPKN